MIHEKSMTGDIAQSGVPGTAALAEREGTTSDTKMVTSDTQVFPVVDGAGELGEKKNSRSHYIMERSEQNVLQNNTLFDNNSENFLQNVKSPENRGIGTTLRDSIQEISPIPLSRDAEPCCLPIDKLGSMAQENSTIDALSSAQSIARIPTKDVIPFEIGFSDKEDCAVNTRIIEAEDQPKNELNESITSSGSLREEELLKTQEELGANSQALFEHLRGAAFRRKLDMTRSRYSLAAKELQQKQAIAASRRSRAERRKSSPLPSKDTKQASPPRNKFKVFKARPLPKYATSKGAGGLSGVPKVETRAPTCPKSPHLGARRKLIGKADTGKTQPAKKSTSSGTSGVPKVQKRPTTIAFSPKLGARRKAKGQGRSESLSSEFDSLQLSAGSTRGSLDKRYSLSDQCSRNRTDSSREFMMPRRRLGGTSGIPKVTKRPITTPLSPFLGARRKAKEQSTANKCQVKTCISSQISTGRAVSQVQPFPRSTSTLEISKRPASPLHENHQNVEEEREDEQASRRPSQLSRTSSVGSCFSNISSDLKGLNFLREQSKENIPFATPKKFQLFTEFKPHSTVRAIKRAQYDAQRVENEKSRIKRECTERRERVSALHEELLELRMCLP